MTEIYMFSKEATKKFNQWKMLKNLLFTIVLVLITFLPVASVDKISIGNYYELLIQKIDKIDSVQHITPIVWLAILCLIVVAINIFSLIDLVVHAINVKRTERVVKPLYKKFIVWVIYATIKIFIIYLLCVLFSKPYGFKMVTPILIAVSLAVSKLLDFIISDIATRKLEVERVVQHQKRKREKKNNEKIKGVWGHILSSVPLFLIISVLLACFAWIGYQGVSLFYVSYDKTLYQSIANKQLKIGEAKGPYTLTIDKEKGIEINWMSSSTTPLMLMGEAYFYYQDKLDEMEEEFGAMMPEGDSEKDLKRFSEKMKALAETIEVFSDICESRSFSYEQLNFEFVGNRLEEWGNVGKKRAYEYIYDAEPDMENPVKWGKEYGLIKQLLYGEKIELSENEFAVGTDFSETEIIATVKYGDGSIRISVIKLSNLEELNSMQAGKQVIKWSDSWGEYEATIELLP